MTYVMSDIHGNYKKYLQAIDAVSLRDGDSLFILGDIVDRGEHPIKILQDMMHRPNIRPILGNHEFVAWSILKTLVKDVSNENLEEFNEDFFEDLHFWLKDGGSSTLSEFKALSKTHRAEILAYFMEFELYEELTCGGTDYVLAHAGLGNFHPQKSLSEYALTDFISTRTDYTRVYYPDKILITGHTPTRLIAPNGDRIYKGNNHIAMDCACGYGGKLGILCLENGQEFYV